MNTRDEAALNARARMTPEERDADIAREIFGPGFYSLFGVVKAPDAVVDAAMVRRAAVGYYSADTMPEKWEPDAVHLRRMCYALLAALNAEQSK